LGPEKYIDAFGNLAQKSTTLLLPSGSAAGSASGMTSDPASFVAQAMSIFKTVQNSPVTK